MFLLHLTFPAKISRLKVSRKWKFDIDILVRFNYRYIYSIFLLRKPRGSKFFHISLAYIFFRLHTFMKTSIQENCMPFTISIYHNISIIFLNDYFDIFSSMNKDFQIKRNDKMEDLIFHFLCSASSIKVLQICINYE